jgi:hypothetical protein
MFYCACAVHLSHILRLIIRVVFALTSDYEVDVLEQIFGLHQLAGVALVEQVVDSVRVDSDRPRNCRTTIFKSFC